MSNEGKRFLIWLLVFPVTFCFFSCAKRHANIVGTPVAIREVPVPSEINTLKALAYVVAERHGVKWANNVSILVKRPAMVRLDAIERITDVVATIVAKDDGGTLYLPLEEKRYTFENGKIMLPKVGEVDMNSASLADILIGRPILSGGGAVVSQAFHTDKGSYFAKGKVDDLEVSGVEGMPLVYTRYKNADKKQIIYEANFDEFAVVNGKKIPRRIIIRFEHPKMILGIKYKDIQPGAIVPQSLMELNEK